MEQTIRVHSRFDPDLTLEVSRMRTLLRRFKECVPSPSRARIRQLLGQVPVVGRLNRLALCPWEVGFVVGGTMKGGTTALSAFLDQHPEIRMATGKEAHFFDAEDQFQPGHLPDRGHYLRQFAPGPTTRILGDATPIYLYWEPAPARVMAYNSRMKWLLLLRQPAERAYSHWNMQRQVGIEPWPFVEALAREPERRTLQPGQCRSFSYLDRGFYARQLRRLFAEVPRRQVLVLRSEELQNDHDATLRRVFEFLGVDPRVRIPPARIHARNYEAPLPALQKREVTRLFLEDIRDLESLLGWDLTSWTKV